MGVVPIPLESSNRNAATPGSRFSCNIKFPTGDFPERFRRAFQVYCSRYLAEGSADGVKLMQRRHPGFTVGFA